MPALIYVPASSTQGFSLSASSPTLVISSLSDDSHLRDVRACVTVVLICISLMISNTEYLFMYLFVMYISLKKCLFRSVHVLIRLLVVCFCLVFPVELYEFFIYFGCHL